MRLQALVFLSACSLLAACGDDPSTSSDSTSQASASETEPTTDATTDPTDPTEGPTTENPTTDGPTTEDPTEGPTTENPTTDGPTTDDPTGGDVLPPTDSAELLLWLENGEYEWWPSDSVHESTGPHFGEVQTFFNPALFDSFEADNAMHPTGAAAVKRLYGDGNQTGWSVMVKVQDDSDGGNGWYWYEYYNGNTYADGTGQSLCYGCHSGGQDYILTPFPLQ